LRFSSAHTFNSQCSLSLPQEKLKQLPPLPASVPALAAASKALAEARGKLYKKETVVLLRDSLSSESLGVRAAALQVGSALGFQRVLFMLL